MDAHYPIQEHLPADNSLSLQEVGEGEEAECCHHIAERENRKERGDDLLSFLNLRGIVSTKQLCD